MIRHCLAAFAFWMGLVSPIFAQGVTSIVPFNAPTTVTRVVIGTGNTFQTVLNAVTNPANNPSARHSLTIQNNNATDTCWLDYGVLAGVAITAATATKGGAIELLAGGSYTRYYPFIPSDELEATCASTSDTMRVEIQ